MSTIGISLVGVAAAYLFTNNITPAEPKVVTEVASNTIEEEEYDL